MGILSIPMEWDVGQVLNRRFQCYLRGWKLSIWISFKMNVLTGFPLKKVRLYFFYSNFQGDNLSRYGLQNNAVIVIDITSREISTFYIMRSTYSILADVLLFRSENIQRSNTATEKWICFWSNWCFIENTCSANSSKNNQNFMKKQMILLT